MQQATRSPGSPITRRIEGRPGRVSAMTSPRRTPCPFSTSVVLPGRTVFSIDVEGSVKPRPASWIQANDAMTLTTARPVSTQYTVRPACRLRDAGMSAIAPILRAAHGCWALTETTSPVM